MNGLFDFLGMGANQTMLPQTTMGVEQLLGNTAQNMTPITQDMTQATTSALFDASKITPPTIDTANLANISPAPTGSALFDTSKMTMVAPTAETLNNAPTAMANITAPTAPTVEEGGLWSGLKDKLAGGSLTDYGNLLSGGGSLYKAILSKQQLDDYLKTSAQQRQMALEEQQRKRDFIAQTQAGMSKANTSNYYSA